MCYVYAIGNSFDNLDDCYIGVALDTKKRWMGHTRKQARLSSMIKTNNWSYELNMKVIFEGSVEECFSKEVELRPFPHIGLNIASGGCGGYTSYSTERNSKISKAHLNRDMTWGNKVSETRIKNGIAKGDKNPRALKWKLIDPNGNEIFLHGDFHSYCEENNLTWSVLKSNEGKPVGEISSKFRDKGDVKIREKRVNTIGWTLIKEN